MEKKVLIRSLREASGGSDFITERKLRIYFGLGQNKIKDLFKGLETIENKYFVPDIADRILEKVVCK